MDLHDAERTAITRLKQGDIDGLSFLVERYQVQAVRAAYLITRNRAQAEDVVQDAFLRAYQRIHQFDSTRPFGPWFLRSVVHAALKAIERQQRHVSLDDTTSTDTALIDQLVAVIPTPDEQAEHADLQNAVWEAMQHLAPSQRAAVVMRYYLGLSERAMSDRMECPVGTVKWRLSAARKQLRTLLRPLQPGASLADEEV